MEIVKYFLKFISLFPFMAILQIPCWSLIGNKLWRKKVLYRRQTHLCALMHTVTNRHPVFLFGRNNVPTTNLDSHSSNPSVIFSQFVGVVDIEARAVLLTWSKARTTGYSNSELDRSSLVQQNKILVQAPNKTTKITLDKSSFATAASILGQTLCGILHVKCFLESFFNPLSIPSS